jgi:hypothetical protein
MFLNVSVPHKECQPLHNRNLQDHPLSDVRSFSFNTFAANLHSVGLLLHPLPGKAFSLVKRFPLNLEYYYVV